jgi:hypothetical protein
VIEARQIHASKVVYYYRLGGKRKGKVGEDKIQLR